MSTLAVALDTLPLAPIVLPDSRELPRKLWTRDDVRRMLEHGLLDTTSVNSDRRVKSLLYARAGIVEYWIVNIPARKLEVYREPTPEGYALSMILSDLETVKPVMRQDAEVRVADLLP